MASVKDRVAAAARSAGRDPADVEILVAVKYLDDPAPLAEAGFTLLGENRAQELIRKAEMYPGVFRWHFIGRLQSRKVKAILPYVELIHSVASESALKELGRHAGGRDDVQILLEVNVAGDEGKAGIAPEELDRYIERSPVQVVGLMTMPPFADDPEASRPHFARLRELAQERGLRHLSMGTSQDFEVAVEEGATIVRLGSAIMQGIAAPQRS
jgi:pyridoxal phosphate enzyme (YggS family)